MAGLFLLVVVVTCLLVITNAYKVQSGIHHTYRALRTSLYSSVTEPVVESVDKEKNVATMAITIPGEATQKAFTKACELFNEEVKERGYTVPGFRKGAKLPPAYLYQIFGEEKLKQFCASLLNEQIQDECEKTGLMFVGRGRIMNFNEADYKPGEPHALRVECDLWPEISYGGKTDGYKGLTVIVKKDPIDLKKVASVKKNIQERYKQLENTPVGYSAKLGDIVVCNMKGFMTATDGSKGDPLPAIATGDQAEVELVPGKFMDGLIEGLVDCQINDVKEITVKFPVRAKGPGAALSGQEAIFEINVINVKTKTLPEWNDVLAAQVRDGMTLADLDAEVRKAVEGEKQDSAEQARNMEITKALMDVMTVSVLPESLVEEQTRSRFEQMLMDFKEQGSTDEQLDEMTSPEKYENYKRISLPNTEKIVKLGMAFRDIAEKEKIALEEKEIQEQVDMYNVQAKQKGEAPPKEEDVRGEIENVLLKKKIFQFLAENGSIEWQDISPEEIAAAAASAGGP